MCFRKDWISSGLLDPTAKPQCIIFLTHRMDYYTDHKQLWVDLTVEGLPDPREYDKKFRIKKQKEYKDVHDGLIKSMKAMEKQHFSAIRHQMWRVHHTKRADIRVNALKGKSWNTK